MHANETDNTTGFSLTPNPQPLAPTGIWTPERREQRVGTGVSAPLDRFRRFVSPVAAYSTSPYGIPGAIAWYKADIGTFQDTAMTTPATADSAPVGGWVDQTGLTHNLIQSGSTARPLLRLAQQNGLPLLSFDGVNDALKALFTLSNPYHIFLVMRQVTWVANAVMIGGGAADNFSLSQSGSSPNLSLWNGTATVSGLTGLAVGTMAIVQVLLATTNSHFKVNAGSNTTLTSGGSAGGINVGSHNNPSNYSKIDVGELIVYNVALVNSDETTVRNGLNARWAIF